MSSGAMSSDEQRVLRDVRALLDQLQLDRGHALSMRSKLSDDLGVDSLALVELCDQLERTFDVSLPDEVFLTATTPQDWLDAVNAARGGASMGGGDGADLHEAPSVTPSSTTRAMTSFEHLVSVYRERLRSRGRARGGSAPTRSPASVAGSVIYNLYAWILLIPFAISIWSLAVLPMPLVQRRQAGRVVARGLCRALGITVKVVGALPNSDQASVIAANHSSFIDGLVLYVFLDQPVTFVASSDMEHQFLLGRIMRGFGCVFVDRGRAEKSAASVATLLNTIQSGRHVLIFPEGSISAQPGLRVFRLGAFETASSVHCPVVPVGIRGSRAVLCPGSYLPHSGAVHVLIGEPIMPTGPDFSDRVEMRDHVREVIERLSGGGGS